MSEWTRPAQPVRCVVELDKPLAVHRERGVLAQGDANANAIVAEVYSTAGKPYDLSGCTMQLIFVRPDNNALPAFNAEINGNTATATLPDTAYAMSGTYSLRMQLHKNGAERTIVWIIGEVKGTDVDGIADPEHVISIGDIMASAKEAQTAASAANTAAERANAGAERAEQLQIDASGLAGDSNKLGGKPPEHYLPVLNLLDNSDFTNPVNQRRYVSGSVGEGKYSIDRWLLQYDTYLHLESDSIALSRWWTLGQRVPVKLYAGKTYTIAAMIKGENGTESASISLYDEVNQSEIAMERKYDIGVDWSLIIKTFTISTDCEIGNAKFDIGINNGAEQTSKTYFKWAALYEDSYTAETLPPYVPPDHTLELAKCMTRYQEINIGGEYEPFATGWAVSESIMTVLLPLPVKMTKAPSVKVQITGAVRAVGNGQSGVLTGWRNTLASNDGSCARFRMDGSGLTPYHAYVLDGFNVKIALSTED